MTMNHANAASVRVYPEAPQPEKRLRWWRRRPKGQPEAAPVETEDERATLEQLPGRPGWNTAPEGVGISLSGGGIRSASFCLGALQSLTKADILFGENHAKYLSSVSGGSYIATAMTMVTMGRIDGGAPTTNDPTDTPAACPKRTDETSDLLPTGLLKSCICATAPSISPTAGAAYRESCGESSWVSS